MKWLSNTNSRLNVIVSSMKQFVSRILILSLSAMALFTMGNMKKNKMLQISWNVQISHFQKIDKIAPTSDRGGYPTPTHGVILYLFAQPEFSPTAIKIKQPSSILRHPNKLCIMPASSTERLYWYEYTHILLHSYAAYCTCLLTS